MVKQLKHLTKYSKLRIKRISKAVRMNSGLKCSNIKKNYLRYQVWGVESGREKKILTKYDIVKENPWVKSYLNNSTQDTRQSII